MADPTPRATVRPTTLAEWTLIGALAGSWIAAMYTVHALAWGVWQATSDQDRIHWLGTAAIGALICMGLIVLSFLSQWVGTIKATAGVASIEIGNEGNEHVQP